MPGAVSVTTLFDRGVALDLTLLIGGVVAGVLLGVIGGRACAMWPRSLAARGLEAFATLMLSVPIYVVGLGLVLLFEPSFGSLLRIPVVFQPGSYQGPGHGVGHWLESMLVPWILVGVPIAAVALRLTAAQTMQNLDEPYVATATAMVLGRRRVVGHAARSTYGMTAALVGTQIRLLVFNIMFVEYVFFLPRLLLVHQARRRAGPAEVARPRRVDARRPRRVVGGARRRPEPALRPGRRAPRPADQTGRR